MKRLLITVGLSVAGIAWMAEAAAPVASVTVQGVRVVKPAPGGDDELRAFNWMPGITVAFAVSVPSGGILKIDRDASTITSMTDNLGADLSKPVIKSKFASEDISVGMFSSISEDGKACAAEVSAPGVPTPGATSVKIVGKLVVQTATKKKEHVAASVALKPGTKVAAGPVALTVDSAEKPKWGNSPWAVTLKSNQSMDSIADIQFFTAEGKLIKSRRGSTSRMGIGKFVTQSWTYNLEEKIDTAKIVISSWTDKRSHTFPLNVSVTLGL